MTSSGAAPAGMSRRLRWLAFGIVAAIALYTAGWFAFATFLEDRAEAALAAAGGSGVEAHCENLTARGYPFRIGIFCDAVRFEDAEGATVSAGAFRSAAQIYDPMRVIAELDGPATGSAPGLPQLSAEWQALRASARLARPLPSRLSVEGAALELATEGERLAGVGSIQAHMRRREADIDVAARFSGLALAPALLRGRTMPLLSGDADATLADGVAFLASGARSLRGRSGEIRSLSLTTDNDAGVRVSGPVSVGADGLVDATLSVSLRNPEALGAVLGGVLPESRERIERIFSALASLAGADGETPPLPLRIVKGRVSVGFIRVGDLPAVP